MSKYKISSKLVQSRHRKATERALLKKHRSKTFSRNGHPLDANAKARIIAFALAWSAKNKLPGQHHGPLTMAGRRVLKALIGFHHKVTGVCFPSYEQIAAKAECSRSTVAEALPVLEEAKVITWEHGIERVKTSVGDLFGRRWRGPERLVRTANVYQLTDPHPNTATANNSKSENRTGIQTQDSINLSSVCEAAKLKPSGWRDRPDPKPEEAVREPEGLIKGVDRPPLSQTSRKYQPKPMSAEHVRLMRAQAGIRVGV